MSKSRLYTFTTLITLLIFTIGCSPTVEPSATDGEASDRETNVLNPAADVETEAAGAEIDAETEIESAAADEMTEDMINLAGTSWKLVSHNRVALLDETEISLNFTDGQVNGNAGCNNFFGNYTQDGDVVMFSGVGATRKACDQNIMDQEAAFLEAISAADGVTISDGALNLRSGDTATLVLERVDG